MIGVNFLGLKLLILVQFDKASIASLVGIASIFDIVEETG